MQLFRYEMEMGRNFCIQDSNPSVKWMEPCFDAEHRYFNASILRASAKRTC